MMVDRLLNYTPGGKLTVFKSGYSVHKVNCRFSRRKFLCFWRCEREHRPAAVTIKLTATSHLGVGCRIASLCQASRHMVSNFPSG